MSFALEYRKKLKKQQQEALTVEKANDGFVALPADSSADTPGNRRRVFLALVLAGGILGVFNSGGLVNYTQGLASNPVGVQLILASEKWDEWMRQKQVTRVVDEIRGTVALVREASWRDLTFGLALNAARKRENFPSSPEVVPANAPEAPLGQKPSEPGLVKPLQPVMRASAENLP